MTVKHVIEVHKYEFTNSSLPHPSPAPKSESASTAQVPPPPQPPKLEMETPKIEMPKPKPEPKPIQMEAKVALPEVKAAPKPAIILAPQPKAALTAAMPAQNNSVKPSTAPVHFGTDIRGDTKSECDAAGDDRGHRQSLRRHARARQSRRMELWARPV